MKQQRLVLLLSASAMLLSAATFAHDPSEHMKEGQKPDCSVLQNMDHSKMDMNDPVMQAMMQKCVGHMHDDNTPSAQDHATDNATKNGAKNSEQHSHEHQ